MALTEETEPLPPPEFEPYEPEEGEQLHLGGEGDSEELKRPAESPG